MKEKVKDLLESGWTVSTQHFYVDYLKEEGAFEIYGSRNLKALQFWNTRDIRDAAKTLIQIADEVDDFRKFSAGEKYFFVHPEGSINKCDITFFTSDYLFMAMDNIFKTKEEAEKHKDEIVAKFVEARKKYVRD